MKPSERIIVSPTEPINNEKVWIQKGKNLFNKNNVVPGTLESDGSVAYSDTYSTSDFIPVVPGKTYYKGLTSSGRVKLYYEDKSPYSDGNRDMENFYPEHAFTIPENIYYIRFTITNGVLDTFQLEQGATATEYEAYIEKAIYVKNDNGVYEEFYKEPNEVVISGTLPSTIDTEIEMSLPDGFTMNNSYILSWKVIYSDINHQQDVTWLNPYLFNGKLRVYLFSDKAINKEIRIVLKKY